MLLPYTTDRPPRNPPIGVVSLVLAHFVVFGLVWLIMGVRGADAAVIWYANLSLVPGSFRPHTLITYAFLHESVLHLSANMLFLWVFGGSVEDAVGWKRFLTLYAAAVVLAGLLEMTMAALLSRGGSVAPIVGASGAISAVVGVFAFRFYRSTIGFIGFPVRVPAILLLALVMLAEMGLAMVHLMRREQGFLGHAAAHWAHVGGFLFGIMWARLTRVVGHGRAEYLELDARQAMDRGGYPSAVSRWEDLLQLQPGNLEYRAELGRALLGMGDRGPAAECFETAIKGLLKEGRKREAGLHYLAAEPVSSSLRLTPSELLAIAGALDEQSNPAGAVSVIERVLAEHSDSPEADMARLRSAALHLKGGNPETARARIEDYLARNPQTELRSYAEDLLRRARGAIGEDGGRRG